MSTNEEKKVMELPSSSSPKPCFITPPKSAEIKKQSRLSLSLSPSLSSPVSSLSSYFKHLLGLNAKTTKRSINEEAECGSPESIEEWIHKGANPNEIDPYGYTPLINASLTNCVKTVKVLIKNGADLNMKAMHGYTALHVAAQNGWVELAELLITNGADLEVKNDDGDTPLMLAVRSEHSNLVDLLCKYGCNRHVIGFDHIDPIDYAINKRNQYLSDVLLKHERKISYTTNSPDDVGCSSSLNETGSHSVLNDELKTDSSIQHEQDLLDKSNNSISTDQDQNNKSCNNLDACSYSVFQSDII